MTNQEAIIAEYGALRQEISHISQKQLQFITATLAVIASGEVQSDTEHVLSFPLPTVTAMCLDIASSNWVASQHFLQDEKFLVTH